MFNKIVHRIARLHQQHHLARALEAGDQFFNAVAAGKVFSLATSIDELVHLLHGAVINRDVETFAFHVQHQVLAHDSKADQPDIHLCHILFSCQVMWR
ncbi:MAG: hypothetical protein BWX80_03652 [Candidatus Hydrogenedentes bacterium ADurb.Bin101]|nr:MAG: hypothetical protein BWX80_03652 [Candidatus Hydrogenedentes bacterium ADurb.Bin101]